MARPQLAVMPAAGGEASDPHGGARPLGQLTFGYSPDGQWIYFTYEHEGGTRLARVRPKDGELEPVESGDQSIGAFDVAKNGAIAARVESGNRGPEILSVSRGRLAAH